MNQYVKDVLVCAFFVFVQNEKGGDTKHGMRADYGKNIDKYNIYDVL